LTYAGVKRKRRISEAQRRRLIEIGFKKPLPAVPLVSQSDFDSTVEGEKTL
jgi:hypothetical protein